MLTKQEIRQLGNKEMAEEITKSRRELLRTQFDVRNGTSKEVHTLKNLKRYIARLNTLAKEMKIEVKPSTTRAAETAPSATAEEKEIKKTVTAKKTAKKKPAPAKKAPKKARVSATK
jgi:large subunit ribosomal protein L29